MKKIVVLKSMLPELEKFQVKQCNVSIVFVWSRNCANWTKAYVKELLAPEFHVMEEQLADPPTAYINVVFRLPIFVLVCETRVSPTSTKVADKLSVKSHKFLLNKISFKIISFY